MWEVKLPFLDCLWNWSDFVTPHPMTVPIHSTQESSHPHWVKALSNKGFHDPTCIILWSWLLNSFTERRAVSAAAGQLNLQDIRLYGLVILLCPGSLCDWPQSCSRGLFWSEFYEGLHQSMNQINHSENLNKDILWSLIWWRNWEKGFFFFTCPSLYGITVDNLQNHIIIILIFTCLKEQTNGFPPQWI